MHLLKGQPRTLTGAAEPVDLEQSPGDIVILSAADTEIAGLAVARRALGEDFPSVRLANWMALAHPYSVDLYGERILAHAKIVVVRLLGGASYWRYGLDEAKRIARGAGAKLIAISGDAAWDAGLAAEGTVDEGEARRLWSYLAEGGSENLANALRYLAHLIGVSGEPAPPQPLASAGVYRWHPSSHGEKVAAEQPDEGVRRASEVTQITGADHPHPSPQPVLGPADGRTRGATPSPHGRGKTPTAAIVFYRALVQAGQTEPVDALCAALAERGLRPHALYVSSLKTREDAAFVERAFAEHQPAIVLNATAFALSQPGSVFSGTVLDGGDRPVLQITFAGFSEEAWRELARGLSPTDLTMNVVLPEVDGRMITRAVSFKEARALDPLTECRPVRFRPKPDRIAFVAELARRWASLRDISNSEKRVAIVLSNYPNRDGRIGNGVGLDTPASTANVLRALRDAGYDIADAPTDGAALMQLLLGGPTNAQQEGREKPLPPGGGGWVAERPGRGGGESGPNTGSLHSSPSSVRSADTFSLKGRRGGASDATLSLADYLLTFNHLPAAVRTAVTARWGNPEADPFVRDGAFILPAHRFGSLVVGIQPARGYNIDPKSTYHDPDLVPPHGYLAFYFWLRQEFGADALIHMGKHGNLEWLPGKALALSAECFPEAALGPLPVIYPFIVNDPGEGAQAKRRIAAIVVDHLMPPMARAESYGAAAELEALIDEYAAAEAADPRRAKALAAKILDRAAADGFAQDLGLDLKADAGSALARLDEHICDLKELQIRDGLHVLGESPAERQRAETLVALARVPRGSGRGGDASILRALADDFGLGFDPLDCRLGDTWEGPRPEALARSLPPCGGRVREGGRAYARHSLAHLRRHRRAVGGVGAQTHR